MERSGEPIANQPGYAPRRDRGGDDGSTTVSDSDERLEPIDYGVGGGGTGTAPAASVGSVSGEGASGFADAVEGLASSQDSTGMTAEFLKLQVVDSDADPPVPTDPEVDIVDMPSDPLGEPEAPDVLGGGLGPQSGAPEEIDETAEDLFDLSYSDIPEDLSGPGDGLGDQLTESFLGPDDTLASDPDAGDEEIVADDDATE